ncbi:MltA domain-containing protein [Aliiroseovarius subalbicans]|uniref:murein transglycosylase A n=1 Tax=Aliiroseovarius subalbicans TaxID=2925840 RepID=UPI001F5A46E5|nr:MltA domain-containing protein [Aliiroseovarius subalbicans]MCI2400077.1 MltA domain-containing protein [Aliiroseovarius subalbicans]
MTLRRLATVLALVATPVLAGLDEADVTILSFDDLQGWDQDDHQAALGVFLDTCRLLDDPEWAPICTLAKTQDSGRTFFELFFRPVLIEDGKDGLFTGYFEPEIRGARAPDARYRHPVYRKPAGEAGYTRRQIEQEGVLRGRGLEIAWVEDPIELQFLQIQGSGRILLPNGGSIRLGYAGSNGHRFRSLGDKLVEMGIYNRHQVSAQVIQSWVRRNPEAGQELMWHNGSYVYFRELGRMPTSKGPVGAMNRSITAERTLAVDPVFTPLGAPVWLEKGGAGAFSRLMVAQDTGSRIKGAQRADIFFGTGDQAGLRAGKVRDPGRMVVLLPIQRAYALSPEG